MFLKMQTQWVMGMAGAVGLNYQSLDFLLTIYKIKNKRKLLEDIQQIEVGALEAIRRLGGDRKAESSGT